MGQTKPTLYVVAGPNGCGKSTFTQDQLRGLQVIDPDAMTHRTAPRASLDAAVAAGRKAIQEQRTAIAAGRTFAIETTLSGHRVLRLMSEAKAKGYRLELHFICVDSVDGALDRIASRVAQGGHDVAVEDVRRRFDRAQANLVAAIAASDESRLYDNTNVDEPYRSVAVLTGTERWFAADPPEWVVRIRENMSL